MLELHKIAILIHVAFGTLGIVLYWSALTTRKGSRLHKTLGRCFFVLLVLAALSVGPVLLLRPGPFDPAYVVQIVYLVTCLCTVSFVGWSAIRWRSTPSRFRGRHFFILGLVLFALGAVVFVAGTITANFVAIVLSWVGLVFGPAMVLFTIYRRPVHPRWWLSWHLNCISALFNAVHGTFLYVVTVHFQLMPEGEFSKVMFQVITIAGAFLMRIWLGIRYKAPMRLATAQR